MVFQLSPQALSYALTYTSVTGEMDSFEVSIEPAGPQLRTRFWLSYTAWQVGAKFQLSPQALSYALFLFPGGLGTVEEDSFQLSPQALSYALAKVPAERKWNYAEVSIEPAGPQLRTFVTANTPGKCPARFN